MDLAADRDPIVGDRQRARVCIVVQLDVRPLQTADFAAAQPRQRQVPGVAEAVVFDVIEHPTHFVLGECRQLLLRPLDALHQRGDVAYKSTLLHQAREDARDQVKHRVDRVGGPGLLVAGERPTLEVGYELIEMRFRQLLYRHVAVSIT